MTNKNINPKNEIMSHHLQILEEMKKELGNKINIFNNKGKEVPNFSEQCGLT